MCTACFLDRRQHRCSYHKRKTFSEILVVKKKMNEICDIIVSMEKRNLDIPPLLGRIFQEFQNFKIPFRFDACIKICDVVEEPWIKSPKFGAFTDGKQTNLDFISFNNLVILWFVVFQESSIRGRILNDPKSKLKLNKSSLKN